MTTSKSLPIIGAQKPRDAPPSREQLEGRTLAAAQHLLDDGDLEQALHTLAPLAVEPTSPVRAHAALLQAGVLLMLGRASDALQLLEHVPRTPAFALDEGYRCMLMACALRAQRRYADALASAQAAVELGPSVGRLLVLADAQKHAGLLAAAIATLEGLLAREHSHATALAQLAGYYHLAGAPNDGTRVFAAFHAAVAREGTAASADVLRNEAFYFATLGDLDSTVAALAGALALEPAATRGYIADEIELDRFRSLAVFRALASSYS